MMHDHLITILGQKKCLTTNLAAYKTDKSYEKGCLPTLVVCAETDHDVKQVLDYANSHNVPITTRGAGSGKSGGAIPEVDGLVLSLEKMNQVIDVDINNQCITVEPGVITDKIKLIANENGLFYPPDPSSSDWCTIGGNIAANSGSSNALKYGVTGDYVLGLEGFFGNGEQFKLGGKNIKDVAGYDLKRLIVGSEGTLAIVTKIMLKLIPKPQAQKSLWCTLDSIQDACRFLQTISRSAIRPAAVEFLEKACVNAVEKYLDQTYDFNQGQAIVLIRLDGDSTEQLEIYESAIKSHLNRFKNTSIFSGDDDTYWNIRRSTSEALGFVYAHKTSEDITVPPATIASFLTQAKHIASGTSFTIIGYGHLGDGNIHTNVLNNSLSDLDWENKKHPIIDQLMDLCIQMGGTLTGEHGIGLTKKKYMKDYFSKSELNIMKEIKRIFDPNHILNPSKLLP